MFNARRSALYAAIVGLGFVASDASACAVNQRAVTQYINGYKCTVCVATGSEVVDVTVQPFEGPEGPTFQPAGDPLTNANVTVSMTGTSQNGTPPGGGDLVVLTTLAPKTTSAPKAPKPPKQQTCNVPVHDDDDADDGHVHTKKIPCQTFSSDSPPDVSGADPSEIVSAEQTMKCDRNGVCTTKVEVFPNDNLPGQLTCNQTGGTPARDFTAKPDADNTFLLRVDVDADFCGPFDEGCEGSTTKEFVFGCYALAGNKYSCEATELVADLCPGSGGPVPGYQGIDNNGDPTDRNYCETGQLPAGDLVCEAPPT